jgi:hypothetical protein
MNAIRVKRKIDSETIHIPELRGMIGQDVEIIVLQDKPSKIDQADLQSFWKHKTLDEIAREQGVKPLETLESPVASQFTPEDWEGFDEALERWRSEGRK